MRIVKLPGPVVVYGAEQSFRGLPVTQELIDCPVCGPNTPQLSHAWKPSKEEIEALQNGAGIIVRILGGTQPPVLVEVGEVEEFLQ